MTPWTDSAQAWPAEPYPGLRPFLEREAALLFGRTRQIAEVIDRLRQTQFVAVLGGSGSGKSSLIHAGVTPELRSYGIHAAGDLWLPTVCTPGTNVSAEDRAAQRHTPVVRLARRFAELLRSRGSAQADAERVDAIAAVFRQDGGFARLLDVFGRELALEPGLKPEEARVLFVLDQFEEVFHPTNADVEDARVLVERTLDHFFAPHPRCYVVLTMRSEHLNDCAGFLELPDAINKSSYLVRRLDEDELEEAIVGPTEHFLRLMQLKRQRDEDSGVDVEALPPLPAQVQFERPVIDRLLKDVGAITHDPDHLPLLQHLLARLWQVAQARELKPLLAATPQLAAVDVVPGRITWADLHGAVTAERAPAGVLGDGNTLRASVDAWPSAAMRKFSAAEREAVDEVLRRLAFKDPKTGMYSQQRLRVQSAAPRILGPGKTADDLYTLLEHRFLSSVNYLYWDRHDPDNVTLKVSHEALIRGWAHFQQLVDAEFQHYEGFVHVLRDCAKWLDNDQSPEALLRRMALEQLRDGGLQQRLAMPELRAMWLRSIKRERDGERLATVEPALDSFLKRSALERLRDRQWTVTRRFGYAVAALVAILLYNHRFVSPYTQQLDRLFAASQQVNAAELNVVQSPPDPAASHPALHALHRAAGELASAREVVKQAPLWMFGVDDQARVIRGVADGLEPAVNGRLRQLLTTTVFGVQRPLGEPLEPPERHADVTCVGERSGSQEVGVLLVDSSTWPSQYRRAVFYTRPQDGPAIDMVLRAASARKGGTDCRFGEQLARLPMRLKPKVVVDSDLRFLIYGLEANTDRATPVSDASATVIDLDWERDAEGRTQLRPTSARSVITYSPTMDRANLVYQEDDFLVQMQRSVKAQELAAAESWPSAGGRTLQVGNQYWRLVIPGAQRLRLDVPQIADTLAAEALPPSGGRLPLRSDVAACNDLAKRQPDTWKGAQVLGVEAECVLVFKVPDGLKEAEASAASAASAPQPASQAGSAPLPRQTALVAVFSLPEEGVDGGNKTLPPIASFSPFGRVRVDSTEGAWQLVRGGSCDGWLLSRERDEGRYLAAPWSTQALRALGEQIEDARKSSQPTSTGCVTP